MEEEDDVVVGDLFGIGVTFTLSERAERLNHAGGKQITDNFTGTQTTNLPLNSCGQNNSPECVQVAIYFF